MAYSFYLAPKQSSILSSRPMAGPLGQDGNGRGEDNGYCFLKKNTVYFRLTVTFRTLIWSVRLSKVQGYWGWVGGWGAETTLSLNSEAQLSEG